MGLELEYIKEIGRALAAKNAAVMVGAGFSKNAEKIGVTKNEFLNWNQLSDLFYEKLYGTSNFPGKEYNNSLRLAQETEIMYGRPIIEEIIRQAVPDNDYAPSKLYQKLMELPWNDVFTTNYDTLLERTTDLITKRRYNVVICQEDLVNSSSVPRIIKLHGSFPSQRPFIITEEDYRTYPIKFAAMVNTVQQSLLENVFCMLGFSCEDPNFINWIGWIHDHLGKSSPKMFMVTITHIPEAKQKLYFERNIIIIDLESMWPDKNVSDRLNSFLDLLGEEVEKKEKQDQWFDWNMAAAFSNNLAIERRTHFLRIIRNNYPGWIFLPWNLKKKVSYVLDTLDFLPGFEKFSFKEQLDYMYEHIKFFDLGGRPLLPQTAGLFYNILLDINMEDIQISEEEAKAFNAKKQTIYLQILRTFRELANWEEFEKCCNSIDAESLDYDEKQFLYAEKCRADLFRFYAKSLTGRLEKWKLSNGDVYWPLIKGQLLAMTGELAKAEDILTENLTQVRRQLKNTQSAYLISIEESNVLLINYIRQNISKELEKFDDESNYWRDTDEKYYLSIQSQYIEKKNRTVKYNFNLSSNNTIHFGVDNTDTFIAMEYWRFFEQTGYSFGIGNAIHKAGLGGSIKRLYRYYPYWSLMQVFIAQEKEDVNYFWSRAELSGLSMEEVDRSAKEYLLLFKTVIQEVRSENSYWPKSIYEQASTTLPVILARFCYKCSVQVLDEMMELLLQLCLSNKQDNFKKLDELIKGIIEGYTLEEQGERIDKILQFPIKSNRLSNYCDPIYYMKQPTELYELNPVTYNKVLLQIRQVLELGNPQLREDGLNRFINLKQLICMKKADEDYLYELLKNKTDLRSRYILYVFNDNKDKKLLQSIVEDTLKKMEDDAKNQVFSSRRSDYAELIWLLQDIHFSECDIKNWFYVMLYLVEATENWLERTGDAKERIRQCCIIAQGILVSLYKDGKRSLSQEEQEAIAKYMAKIKQIYGNMLAFQVISKGMIKLEEAEEDYQYNLWICSEQNIDFLTNFIYILINYDISIKENESLYLCLQQISKTLTYRLMNAGLMDAKELLKTLTELVKCECLSDEIIGLLGLKLEMLIEETLLQNQDNEKEVYDKMHCRIAACKLSAELYREKIEIPAILKWKSLSESTDEFIEIRRINFE